MRPKAHAAILALILLGLVLILVLLFRGPRFTAQGITIHGGGGQESIEVPDTQVTCTATGIIGWPSDHAFMASETDSNYTWDADLPALPPDDFIPISTGLEKECSERRDSYLGFLVIVAIPTTVLMSVAITRRPASWLERQSRTVETQ